MIDLSHQLDVDFERVSRIVERHPRPAFVTGFDIRFDATMETPTVWVAFKTVGEPARNEEAITARGEALHALRVAVQKDLYSEIAEWVPRFVFERDKVNDLH